MPDYAKFTKVKPQRYNSLMSLTQQLTYGIIDEFYIDFSVVNDD